VARVAAGEIARKILAQSGIEVMAFVRRIGSIEVSYEEVPFHSESSEKIHNFWWPSIAAARAQSRFRLPSLSYEERIAALADRAKENEDSWGGSVECWVKGLPAGLGEPVFDKLGAVLGHALLSLPAAVAFQVGGGESLAGKPGSMSRDPIVAGVHHPRPSGNLHGGLLGGISTGEPLWAKVDFHAPTSLPQATASVNLDSGNPQLVRVIGRHDSIPLPRAVPMVEAMVMLVLADAMLLA
jgi:chorismate synthase